MMHASGNIGRLHLGLPAVRRSCQYGMKPVYHRRVPSLIVLTEVRIESNGVPVVDSMSLSSKGDWILVLSGPRALFEAISGLRRSRRGEIQVSGMDPAVAAQQGVAATAPLDPPLPGRWTVREYISWSARLTGKGRGASNRCAARVIEQLHLGEVERRPLRSVPLLARRATVLAAAIATEASVLLVEDPFVGLSDACARTFGRTVTNAFAGARVAFFATRVALDSPVALAADEAIVIEGSHVAAQGPPAEIASAHKTVSLRVVGDTGRFERLLEEQGAKLLRPATSSGSGRLSVDLGTLKRVEVFRIARACDIALLEVRPLSSAFA
jgi:ABC-type multidrug transport system ATPase subunit